MYRGDVTQLPQLMEAITANGVTRVIHMAALLPPDTEERPHFAMQVNIGGANNVFEAARWCGIERVVYASSIAVYGVQDTFGERPINEDDVNDPINVYGMTKSVNDFSARRYSDLYGLDLRGIRICTVFGHGRVTGMTGMIGGLMVSLPAIGQPISMPIHEDEPSPMIHAEDAAEIFVRAALAGTLNHRTYISGGNLATIREMADAVPQLHPRRPDHHRRPHRAARVPGGQQPDAGGYRLRDCPRCASVSWTTSTTPAPRQGWSRWRGRRRLVCLNVECLYQDLRSRLYNPLPLRGRVRVGVKSPAA